jgi:prolyl-tRNA editing enzyme YbaK/EbsC (Cys-tRNA(Pro) deacylase)
MHPRTEEFLELAREAHGFDPEIAEFPEGTKTAADAAAAIGCDVAQIGSSIVFVADGEPVVVVTSGANRVSKSKLAGLLGVAPGEVRTADPDQVRAATGWSIGGVPPFCHDDDLPVFVDETLTEFDTVWVAAGTPEAVFPIAPDRILAFADARAVDVVE